MKAKCGSCCRYVKTVPIEDGEEGEVEFICKKCGNVTDSVEFEREKGTNRRPTDWIDQYP